MKPGNPVKKTSPPAMRPDESTNCTAAATNGPVRGGTWRDSTM